MEPKRRIPRILRHQSDEPRAAYPEYLRYVRRLTTSMEDNVISESVCRYYDDKGESYVVALFANH
ncbi:hypothetical protein DPMN_112314 [Dreissena polymorpha]|uniref:Uncharacterized protein n=1 Tax=Dreissena polymorpha TaxID=45954 RepID=A0A9D4KFF3_DREPO|nr:hypothetical protein DPMN_112314 [Dreissena polymorpha]